MGSTGTDASTMTAPPPPPPKPPKRGGIHSQYGEYIGGAKLNDNYEMSTGDNSLYRFATQRRHEKTITAIERSLREARDSITAIKFNGTLDTTPGNVNEIGKERFITLLKKRVKEHGQQTFYWIRDSDGKVVDLFDNSHRFKLDTVVAEHKRRLEKRTDFETYDEIERDEVELSRTVVESLLTETFQEKIEIQFSHREDFEFLPGSCLFMMALETCNASAFYDVEGARKKLESLELSSYPGENVTEFASEAQRLIKIMQSAYSMPVNTGSQMIHKVTKTSSELFNRKMWTLLDSAMLLEMEYEMSDHKLFVKDKDYDKYGPLAIVATMQATHGMLLSQHLWPALTATIPQGNAAPVVGGSVGPGNAGSSALNGRKCYRCQGDHLVRDCPHPSPAGGTSGITSGGGGTAGRVRTPLAAWKYEKPNDVTIPRVDAQGKVWKFCTKCKCRATGKVGYYQLSHYDADHVYNYRRSNGNSTGSSPATDNSTAPPETSSSPQGNLTAVANPNPIPPGPPDVTTPEPSDAHDLHEIQFTGMHGMWIAGVNADITADATMTELVTQRSSTPTRARTIGLGMWCASTDLAVNAVAFIDCIRQTEEANHEWTNHSKPVEANVGSVTTQAARAMTDETFAMLATDPYALISIGGTERQPVVFDTGASLGITFDKSDFDGPITIPEGDLRLGGMAQGLKIEGVGPVTWTFRNSDDSELTIRSQCYFVPEAKMRLLSPQRLFNKDKGVVGKFEGDEDTLTLHFEGCTRLVLKYDPRNHLPIGCATIGAIGSPTISAHQCHLALYDEGNQNITAGHKLLLNWHSRFGHLNFPAVQRILRQFPFQSAAFGAASKCDLTDLKCEICQYAKAHRRTTHGKKTHVNEERDGSLKAEHLTPGAKVSVDHFESRILGRTKDSYGKATSDKYKGGAIFVDHATGYLHVEHQLGFSAVETVRAKQSYESMAFEHGIVVQSYLTDSGAFKAKDFVQHIRDHAQQIRYCGTNAHHQNGIAERSIRTVSNMARAMLLHSSAHWKNGIDASLWPMAVTYAIHVYNNTPNAQNLFPADLYTGSTVPRHRLRDLHTWGCPVYVLDPTLQAGKKLPRWEPRSRRGVFVGLSNIHSSEVPMVLNLTTGSITTQYHVVFDDRFTTVQSIGLDEPPPTHWDDLCLENTLYVPTDGTPDLPVHLHDDWLTEAERELKYRDLQRQERVRQIQHPTAPALLSSDRTTKKVTNGKSPSEGATMEVLPLPPELAALISEPMAPSIAPSLTETSTSTGARPIESQSVKPTTTVNIPVIESISGLRRSTRATRGNFQSTKYSDESYMTSVEPTDYYTSQLAYLAEVSTCFESGIENVVDPRVYAAKAQMADPDSPTFHQAMNGEFAEEYVKAMQLEIATLVQQNTWTAVTRTPDMNVLKGTWVFKLKRLPDGTPSRFKARFCARGDLQQEGVDFFDTYAPVVQWSTIRLLLSTVLTEGWATRQVDYTNAFAQAALKEEVYLEFPKMFSPKSGENVVLRLLKSLYGLRQAPRTFFEKLRDGLLERGYTQSQNDPCLFMKRGILCVVYVDDTIFAGADSALLESEIRQLGVSDTEQQHSFQLRNEGEVGAFLGIQITKEGPRTFSLVQSGLIAKVLATANMTDCNGVTTPTGPSTIGTDADGPIFAETWKYRTVVGMLMYLAANTRPDIAYAVHQAARFSHAPRQSHAIAVKRILRYLKSTEDKGMIMTPTEEHRVDCYVDSDFAGNFAVENAQDPVSVKSRTGYIILYRGSPLLWVSKMQTQVALSSEGA